jgi:hypothetical protein
MAAAAHALTFDELAVNPVGSLPWRRHIPLARCHLHLRVLREEGHDFPLINRGSEAQDHHFD